MTGAEADPVREGLEKYVGKPMGPPSVAPDPVNVPMIRHWVDALDDRNPVYLDEAIAARTRFGGTVAPPAMLQVWGMARPKIQGIAERGGAPDDLRFDNPIAALDAAGYVGTLATNSELEFVRYLRPGDHLTQANEVESISSRKTTALGEGYFLTWVEGAPDAFMNILTTNGYVARYATDWAGPEAMLRSIKIRLGAPAVPGRPLRFTGRVTAKSEADGESVVELAVRAANDLGDHATGTVTLSLRLG
jgi:hypothetical protein